MPAPADLQPLIDQLDAAVPRVGPFVSLCYDHGGDTVKVYANQAGYVRLAAELLRASTRPAKIGEHVPPELDVDLHLILRQEDWTPAVNCYLVDEPPGSPEDEEDDATGAPTRRYWPFILFLLGLFGMVLAVALMGLGIASVITYFWPPR